jgi:hypothetical protein
MPIEKIGSGIRAEYKELARRIIANDRSARKYGLSQNTIGEIERALVAAYRRGHSAKGEGVATPVPQSKKIFVEWIDLPPRCRETLWSISHTLSRTPAVDNDEQILLEQTRVYGRLRWRQSGSPYASDTRTFSEGGVIPLVRLGLLNIIGDKEAKLVLSPNGIATCIEYWRRWRARDPTLPIQSLRV